MWLRLKRDVFVEMPRHFMNTDVGSSTNTEYSTKILLKVALTRIFGFWRRRGSRGMRTIVEIEERENAVEVEWEDGKVWKTGTEVR